MKILLVENIAPCSYLFRNTLHEPEFSNHFSLQHMRTGEETLMFLRNLKNFRFAVSPDIIILDQELPDRTGHELIEGIREMAGVNEIPLIMIGNEIEPEHPFGAQPDEYYSRPTNREDVALLMEQAEGLMAV